MQVVARPAGAVLALDELVGHLHRPGSEQSNNSRQVVEPVRLQTLDEVAHAERLELEHRRRAALPQQLVGLGIVDGNRIDVERRLAAAGALAIDRRDGLVDDRERLQSQEVELDEADRLEIVLVELRQQRAVGIGIERHVLGDRLRRDHDAAGMRADVAREALEALRQIDEPAHLFVVLVNLAQLFVVGDRFVERDADLERNQLRDPVDVAVRHAERAADVAHDGARGHRAVGRDLRDSLAAVALARRSR